MPGFLFASYSLETILLVFSALVVISAIASKASGVFGVPTLLLFLGIGMLAGSDGLGKIAFTDYKLAYAIGSISLALILFDGGMRTSWTNVKPILGVGISLSFIGVLATALVTALFTHFILNLTWQESMLLGAIISSTDAAAVFSILNGKNLSLKGRLKQVLEFEAGSNDPSAIFLTMATLILFTAPNSNWSSLVIFFLSQCAIGIIGGWLGGKGIRWLINNINIDSEGLYNVLLLGLMFFLFAGVAKLNGSGFLAVYVAGLYLGNNELLHKTTLMRFYDGIAWIAQILLFVTLGLLAFPSKFADVWQQGLILALFLMFVARPLSVLIAAPTKVFNLKERTFISWVGLRGGAPIVLAILPWSVNYPNADHLYALVCFVVFLSVLAQGMTIPWIANKLDVIEPLQEDNKLSQNAYVLPPGFLSLQLDVHPQSMAINQRVIDLPIPSGILLTILKRQDRYIVPRGDTMFEENDRVWCLAEPDEIDELKNIFEVSYSEVH